jgi:hypothetical protein
LAEGKAVTVEWKFSYSGSSVRPSSLEVRFSIDGVTDFKRFNNAPGGK